MCGICAHSCDPDAIRIRAMNAELTHRGPDDGGCHLDPRTATGIAARRLSIIDIADGHQPIANETGTVVAALNGEIYNFERLRQGLLARGHRIATHCDTEVLVHLYEEHGPDLVHALEGMFAFVLWDAERRILLAARDRFGEKPLFYCRDGRELALASEPTALTAAGCASRRVSAEALDEYFVLGYVQSPHCIFEEISQLPPGHLLTWEQANRSLMIAPYWQPPMLESSSRHEPFAELVDEADELLTRSVRDRLRADVPVGVFLSGGVDSALVATLAAAELPGTLRTFTVGYAAAGETAGETGPARDVARALGSEHRELILSQAEIARAAPRALAQLDQPQGDQAFLPLHLLASAARPEITVAIGGEGADELFGGYPRVRWLELARRMSCDLPAPVLQTVVRGARHAPSKSRVARFGAGLEGGPLGHRHLLHISGDRQTLRPRIYGPQLVGRVDSDLSGAWAIDGGDSGRHVAADLMRLDQMHWLPDDVLAKADRATMLASLEMRTPFLHREVAEFAASVPVQVHVRDGGKTLLRQLLERRLGRSFAGRGKRAFIAPTAEWLRGGLGATLTAQIAESSLYGDGWIDRGSVAALAQAHRRREADHSAVLWPLLSLGCWWDARVPAS